MTPIQETMTLLRSGDTLTCAVNVFHQLDGLARLPVPSMPVVDTEVLRVAHGAPSSVLNEYQRTQYAEWLRAAAARAEAIGENKRRLRTTMWCEVTLRRSVHADFAAMLGQFHREEWRIAYVDEDSAAREKQVVVAVRFAACMPRQEAA